MNRLDDVVIRANVEALYLVANLVECGEEQHRHLGIEPANFGTQFEAPSGAIANHYIEDYQVIRGLFERRKAIGNSVKRVRNVARFGERAAHNAGDADVVLDHQNLHVTCSQRPADSRWSPMLRASFAGNWPTALASGPNMKTT